MAAPNPPDVVGEAGECSVTLRWDATEGATGYKIMVTDFGSDEFAAEHVFDAATLEAEIDGLYPTSTFQFRLVVLNEDGESEPSGACDVDTAVVDPTVPRGSISCPMEERTGAVYGVDAMLRAAESHPKQLELLDLAKLGKLALLTNDRTMWVSTLACISGYDATALSAASSFWRERLAHPTLLSSGGLWLYYLSIEFPRVSPQAREHRIGALHSGAISLFRILARPAAAMHPSDFPHIFAARGMSSWHSCFVHQHVARAHAARERDVTTVRNERREKQRVGRTLARRCVVHPLLCVGTLGCFALPVPLLIVTAAVLSVQSAVVASLPSEEERLLWGVGAYGMWMWTAPIATIGLCWCIAAFASCAAHVVGFMEPHSSADADHDVDGFTVADGDWNKNRTIAQMLASSVKFVSPASALAAQGLWLDGTQCCWGAGEAPRCVICWGTEQSRATRACVRRCGTCGAKEVELRLPIGVRHHIGDAPVRGRLVRMMTMPPFGKAARWEASRPPRHNACAWAAGLRHALHCCTALKSVPMLMACSGMVALVFAPVALVSGSALEAGGAVPASLWWLWFTPLFCACACCSFAPCAAGCFADGGPKDCLKNNLVGALVIAVVAPPCVFALMAAIALSAGADHALPAWAVLMPIWVWIGLTFALFCLLAIAGCTCVPVCTHIWGDFLCGESIECLDYLCVPCRLLPLPYSATAEEGETVLYAVFNIVPHIGTWCVLLPVSATAVLGCLKFTDGYRDAVPVWLIGLPIIVALCTIAIPLCVCGVQKYKSGWAEVEGKRMGASGEVGRIHAFV